MASSHIYHRSKKLSFFICLSGIKNNTMAPWFLLGKATLNTMLLKLHLCMINHINHVSQLSNFRTMQQQQYTQIAKKHGEIKKSELRFGCTIPKKKLSSDLDSPSRNHFKSVLKIYARKKKKFLLTSDY